MYEVDDVFDEDKEADCHTEDRAAIGPLERPWKMSPIFQVGGEPDGGAEHQSKCGECGCLEPDLVMEEYSRTCWADNSNKRRIETPMERRRSKYPKTNFWASAPRK